MRGGAWDKMRDMSKWIEKVWAGKGGSLLRMDGFSWA